MLQRLSIQNYAIIDEVAIDFGSGMVVMTGETGAGKSIMLGAMGLLLGDRVQSSVLNPSIGPTIVEGDFRVDLSLSPELKSQFDIEKSSVVIRRLINTAGRSRAFVNDIPCSLQDLRELSAYLIDIHRQFDNSWLFATSNQIEILDTLADQLSLAREYDSGYRQLLGLREEIVGLEQAIADKLKEQDFLRFQLQELDELPLHEMEVEVMEADLARYDNMDRIKEVLSLQQRELQDSETNMIDRLRTMALEIEDSPMDEATKTRWSQIYHNAIEELDAMAAEMMDIGEGLFADAAHHQSLAETLASYYRLQKKHQALDQSELISIRDGIESKLTQWENDEGKLDGLRVQEKELLKTLVDKAARLSQGRKASAKIFGQQIEDSLADLAMANARFEVRQSAAELGPHGNDDFEFLFSANPGQEPRDFRQIASGGERSRLALCIKQVVAGKLAMPTVVFDEIDSGVSGDTALKMAHVLRALSQQHQIIVITHSPQVASAGDQHLFISKEVSDGRSQTNIQELSSEARLHEVAVMLSSNPPSTAALKNAGDLLGLHHVS